MHGVTSKSSKIIELLDKIQENGITVDVILFCKTFLKDGMNTNLTKGYQSVCINHKNTKLGGVAIYMHNDISFKSQEDLSIFYEGLFESCFVEIEGFRYKHKARRCCNLHA